MVSVEHRRHPIATVSVASMRVRVVSFSGALGPEHFAMDSKNWSFQDQSVRPVKEAQVVDSVSDCLQPRPRFRAHQVRDQLAPVTGPRLQQAQLVEDVEEAHSMAVAAQLLPTLTFDCLFRTGPDQYFVD